MSWRKKMVQASHTFAPYKSDNWAIEQEARSVLMSLSSRDRVDTRANKQDRAKIRFPRVAQVIKVELVGAEFPYINNVDQYNNKVDVTDNGGSFTVTIDDGNYSGTQLASALEDGLNSGTSIAGNPYTVAYDTTKQTFRVETADVNGVTLNFNTGSNASTSLAQQLGWDTNDSDPTRGSAGSLTSTYQADLKVSRKLYVSIGGLTSLESSHNVSEAIAVVYVYSDRAPKVVTLTHVHPQPKYQTSEFEVVITDEQGNTLDLHNRDYDLQFRIWIAN